MNAATHKSRLAGNLVSTVAGSYWVEIRPLLDRLAATDILELDLRAAKMIDSVGLNMLVKAIREAESRGGAIRILVGSESLVRLLRFTRLDQRAEILGP